MLLKEQFKAGCYWEFISLQIKQTNNLASWAAKIEQEDKTTVNKKAHLKGCAPKLKMQCWNDIKLAPAKNPALEKKQQTESKILAIKQTINTNLLLTEREGRTGEYWPEVVAVRTERSEVRTKTTEGQYSTVRLEQARLVSSLLYVTLSLIMKCTSGGLHLKMFVFSIYLWNFGKFTFFLFSSDSFNVKNDIIHTFFAVLVANFEFAGFAPKQKYTDWTISMETVRTAKSWPRKNQS